MRRQNREQNREQRAECESVVCLSRLSYVIIQKYKVHNNIVYIYHVSCIYKYIYRGRGGREVHLHSLFIFHSLFSLHLHSFHSSLSFSLPSPSSFPSLIFINIPHHHQHEHDLPRRTISSPPPASSCRPRHPSGKGRCTGNQFQLFRAQGCACSVPPQKHGSSLSTSNKSLTSDCETSPSNTTC